MNQGSHTQAVVDDMFSLEQPWRERFLVLAAEKAAGYRTTHNYKDS
jgi:hypothetical protein